MKKKDKIRKIIVYSLAVIFLLGSIQVHVPSGNPQWMLSEKETVLTSFSEDMKLVFLGTLLSGTGQIEKFSRKYLERMVYVIRYMQDMDGRKKHHFCYE